MKNYNIKKYGIGVLILAAGIFIGRIIIPSNHPPSNHHQSDHHQSDHHTITPSNHQEVWTCSMHPQIRQNEPGQCPLCGMDLIPLRQNGAAQTSPFIHTMTEEAIALANVQTLRVGNVKETTQREIQLTGRVQADEQNLAVITADYSGRIENLAINFTGQQMNKGQVIATIYSSEIVTAQRELLEARKTKETNPALYEAAIEKLRLWKLSDSQIQKIEQSGEPITKFNILAHKSGIVINRYVSTGDYIGRGDVLFDVADLSRVWVLFDAYETDFAAISQGDKILFSVAAYPGKEFTATVSFIDPVINPQTRTVSVRAEAPNPNRELKPEMFVRGTVKAGNQKKESGITVPRTAVLWTGKRSIVYVKVPDVDYPAFEMREVVLGPRIGDSYIIESGLTAGEEVVVNGAFSIDAAAQLNGNYSMMNRPVDLRIEVPVKFREQLTNVAKAYFEVKNALIESNFSKTQTAAKQMQQQLSKVDKALVSGEVHHQWMQKQKDLSKHLSAFVKAKDIEEQRTHFEPISNIIIEIAETYRLTINRVYKAYCPMALDDEGAHWLSEFEAIKNPYFGDAMLRCGEVKSVIEKDKPVYRDKQPQAKADGHKH
jgi:membrane fusion protein, copper/silver efflux system